MLQFFTVVIMLALGYAYLVEGLFTACLMCINVIGAGLIAFNFWEPLANLMDPALRGFEDALCLVLLFCVSLGALRTLTNLAVATEVEFPIAVQRGGGALFGALTGYLVTGFIVCVMQTLPFHQNFSYFDAKYEKDDVVRRFLPSDRVWLAMMHHAGLSSLRRGETTFDEHGSYEQRYQRHRRYDDDHETTPNSGDFDASQYPAKPKTTE
jgi:hypothetical protein